MPVKRETARQKPEETPSRGSGLSEEARKKLDAYHRSKHMPSGPSGSNVISSKSNDTKPAGLGDFQSRLNRNTYGDRDRDRGYSRDGRDRDSDRKTWNDAPTPKSVKGEPQWDGGSMRVPNRGWDETPRGARDAGRYGKGDAGKGRGWDETPRSVRVKKEFPDLEDGEEMAMNGQEWEEEQVRLDRDWYSYDDEGAVVSWLRTTGKQQADVTGGGRRAQSVWAMGERREGERGRDGAKGSQAPNSQASSICESKEAIYQLPAHLIERRQ